VLDAFSPVREQGIPLDHIELDVEKAFRQALLYEFIHRQREHLAGARRRCLGLDLELSAGGITGFPHQLARFVWIILDLEFRIPSPWMTGLECSGGVHHQAAEQAIPHRIAIDAEICGFADANVVPRRGVDSAELPRPYVGLLV